MTEQRYQFSDTNAEKQDLTNISTITETSSLFLKIQKEGKSLTASSIASYEEYIAIKQAKIEIGSTLNNYSSNICQATAIPQMSSVLITIGALDPVETKLLQELKRGTRFSGEGMEICKVINNGKTKKKVASFVFSDIQIRSIQITCDAFGSSPSEKPDHNIATILIYSKQLISSIEPAGIDGDSGKFTGGISVMAH